MSWLSTFSIAVTGGLTTSGVPWLLQTVTNGLEHSREDRKEARLLRTPDFLSAIDDLLNADKSVLALTSLTDGYIHDIVCNYDPHAEDGRSGTGDITELWDTYGSRPREWTARACELLKSKGTHKIIRSVLTLGYPAQIEHLTDSVTTFQLQAIMACGSGKVHWEERNAYVRDELTKLLEHVVSDNLAYLDRLRHLIHQCRIELGMDKGRSTEYLSADPEEVELRRKYERR